MVDPLENERFTLVVIVFAELVNFEELAGVRCVALKLDQQLWELPKLVSNQPMIVLKTEMQL